MPVPAEERKEQERRRRHLEITANQLLPNGQEIEWPDGYNPHQQVTESEDLSFSEWKDKVNHGGPWDWKRLGHNGTNDITHPEYEALGNFDYGVTGMAIGLPPAVIRFGGTYAAWTSGQWGDSPEDQAMIDQGIKWYEMHYGPYQCIEYGYSGPGIKYHPY